MPNNRLSIRLPPHANNFAKLLVQFERPALGDCYDALMIIAMSMYVFIEKTFSEVLSWQLASACDIGCYPLQEWDTVGYEDALFICNWTAMNHWCVGESVAILPQVGHWASVSSTNTSDHVTAWLVLSLLPHPTPPPGCVSPRSLWKSKVRFYSLFPWKVSRGVGQCDLCSKPVALWHVSIDWAWGRRKAFFLSLNQ